MTAFVLKPCPRCYQMTNHIGDVCQKCKKRDKGKKPELKLYPSEGK
jgi:hypothetical protein